MALHFPLMVNDERIGLFVAQRREQVVPADRVCTSCDGHSCDDVG